MKSEPIRMTHFLMLIVLYIVLRQSHKFWTAPPRFAILNYLSRILLFNELSNQHNLGIRDQCGASGNHDMMRHTLDKEAMTATLFLSQSVSSLAKWALTAAIGIATF